MISDWILEHPPNGSDNNTAAATILVPGADASTQPPASLPLLALPPPDNALRIDQTLLT